MPAAPSPQPPGARRVATVALLRRFPLRSAGGEQLQRVWIGEDGLDGDRRFVLTREGEPLGVKDLPELADVDARIHDGALVLDPPIDGLALAAGGPVSVQESPTGHLAASRHSGGAAVHLVSNGAARAPDAPAGCDPGVRANVVLALDPAAAPPGAERRWVGARLRLGEVELVVTRTPSRCLGVYADVAGPGWLAVGDAAWLLTGPAKAAR